MTKSKTKSWTKTKSKSRLLSVKSQNETVLLLVQHLYRPT